MQVPEKKVNVTLSSTPHTPDITRLYMAHHRGGLNRHTPTSQTHTHTHKHYNQPLPLKAPSDATAEGPSLVASALAEAAADSASRENLHQLTWQ